jgi:acetyl esterase
MKKLLLGSCAGAVLAVLIAGFLVNRWASTPHGRLDLRTAVLLKVVEATAGKRDLSATAPSELRAWYNDRFPKRRVVLESVEDLKIPGPGGQIPIRIYAAEGSGARPVIVYYHGGGWVVGNLETHGNVAGYLAKASGGIVVSVDYRLAPEHPFPAAVEDAYAALEWASGNAARLGGDPGRIAVAGDSAGGNLAAVVSLKSRDANGPKIRCQALIYPVTNLVSFDTGSHRDFAEGFFLTKEAMEWFRSHYLPDPQDRENPYASPLLARDHANLPPAVVITAQFDPLRDEGEAYAAKLAQGDVPVERIRYDGMIHGFVSFLGLLDEAEDALDRIAARIRRTR